MDSNTRVKCCCIINMNSQNKPGIASLVVENPVFFEDLQNESNILYQTLLSQQSNSSLQYAPIQKLYSHSGAWYSTNRNNTTIALLVTAQYPMASAMRLLKSIEELLKRQIATGKPEFQQYEPSIRDLLSQYDKDAYSDDKVEITCKSVDSVQGLMEENIKKIQYNQEQLQVIHHKSADVTQMAQQFQKGAKDINIKMAWQQYMLYGVLGAIILGIILYFII